ncbi:MAG: hypothetical protein WC426_13645 [Sulfuriferula sp.]
MSDQAPITAELYSYGGCTSCGNSLWNWLRTNEIAVTHYNVQITNKRKEAMERAAELGVSGKGSVYFPMIFIGGKVVIGFKPQELEAIINELNEGN